jgi:Flp pilus assembly protein TadD
MLAEKYRELAFVQQKLGQHEPAIELFTEAIALAPQEPAAYSGRAQSLTSLGKKDQATADLAQAQRYNTRR